MSARVAVICSVLNEAGTIDALLDSLAAQTRPPDEIVIVDGGSRDGTLRRVRDRQGRGAPIRLVELPGSNIAAARNAGIRAAAAAILAITDCGVRLEPDWLERLIAPLVADNAADVAAGFFLPDPRGAWETALSSATLISRAEVVAETFLPSSRSVAFRRDAWERVGGYPEWLEHSEDVVFDLALRRAECRFVFVPDAIVHFRPRPTPRAFFRQYYLYARGDGKADLWRRRHAIRYAAYTLGPLTLAAGLRWRRLWLAAAIAAAAYLVRPYRRLYPWLANLTPGERLAAVAWVPLVRLLGDIAKMVGYPVGVWWRLRRRT